MRGRVPRLQDAGGDAIARTATTADARICLAREYGMRTWAELAAAADRACETHYSRLPPESPWKRAEGAIHAGDARELQRLLDAHPALEHEDPGMTLLAATAQPEAGRVPREVVDVLVTAGSELDVPLNLAACFDKADVVGWLLDAGADAASTEIWGITPLQTAAYHGARAAADVLVARTGLLPDAFYIAAAAGDVARLEAWFDADGRLRPEAMRERPNLADVGWPPRPPLRDDPDDVLAEALAIAAHLGRAGACAALLDRGADPARAPLYGIAPLHFAASMGRREAIAVLVTRGAPLSRPRRAARPDATGVGAPQQSHRPQDARAAGRRAMSQAVAGRNVDCGHRRALVCRGDVRLGGGRPHVHHLPPTSFRPGQGRNAGPGACVRRVTEPRKCTGAAGKPSQSAHR